ncbi:MAG TPA: TIGR03619 family F420-dependent LLM class oxidoreductase [Candidatus Dormibacteraeota bacterium]
MPRPARGGLGISISAHGRFITTTRELLDVARRAEALGFDQISIGEHVLLTVEVAGRGGSSWHNETASWPDPLVTLAAIAAVTERLRLCTSIYIVPLRPAAAVAKMAATVDAISGGRLTFGVGAGWQEREFAAVGVAFAERFGRFEDALRACKVLWTQAPATFHSRTVNLEEVWCLPQPVQVGGPPILMGGEPGPSLHRRVTELADGWIVRADSIRRAADPDAELQRTMDAIRARFVTAGRDPDRLMFQIGGYAVRDAAGRIDHLASFDRVRALWGMGLTMVQLSLAEFVDSPESLAPFLEMAARELL